ncbi:MAG: TetR/AcrR family transcriptional regulator [Pseudomonadales bacterium]
MDHYQQRKSKTRQRILDAGWHLMRRDGVTPARVSDICDAAGVARKTFFNHFSSKDELLLDLAQGMAEEMYLQLGNIRKETPRFEQQIDSLFILVGARIKLHGVMHPEFLLQLLHTSNLEAGNRGSYELKSHFLAMVNEAIDDGQLAKASDALGIANVVFGVWYAIMMVWVYEGPDTAIEQARDTAIFIHKSIGNT